MNVNSSARVTFILSFSNVKSSSFPSHYSKILVQCLSVQSIGLPRRSVLSSRFLSIIFLQIIADTQFQSHSRKSKRVLISSCRYFLNLTLGTLSGTNFGTTAFFGRAILYLRIFVASLDCNSLSPAQNWCEVPASCPYPRHPNGLHTRANWHLQCVRFLSGL